MKPPSTGTSPAAVARRDAARGALGRWRPCRARAAVCSASVTSTWRASTHARGNAAARRTPPPRCGCWRARPSRASRRARAATRRRAAAQRADLAVERREVRASAASTSASSARPCTSADGDADVPRRAGRSSSCAASLALRRRRPAGRSRRAGRSPSTAPTRRRPAGASFGLARDLLADDADDAGHRLGVGDRRAAELHDDVHSSPSRCISSAFRIAAPAAPRIVLWPSATNL